MGSVHRACHGSVNVVVGQGAAALIGTVTLLSDFWTHGELCGLDGVVPQNALMGCILVTPDTDCHCLFVDEPEVGYTPNLLAGYFT